MRILTILMTVIALFTSSFAFYYYDRFQDAKKATEIALEIANEWEKEANESMEINKKYDSMLTKCNEDFNKLLKIYKNK